MAKDNNLNDFLTDLADAIRDKKGTTDTINAQDFADEIASIETGITPSGNIELQAQTGNDVTNYATASVKSGSASTPATTITQSQPTISVDSAGLITASVGSKTQSVTPSVSAGWVASGSAGTITLGSNSNTKQLTTKGATTYNTSTSNQTIASGTYLTGTQTIRAVTTSNITAGNIKSGVVVKVGDAGSSTRIKNVTGTFKNLFTPASITAPTLSVGSATRTFDISGADMNAFNLTIQNNNSYAINYSIPLIYLYSSRKGSSFVNTKQYDQPARSGSIPANSSVVVEVYSSPQHKEIHDVTITATASNSTGETMTLSTSTQYETCIAHDTLITLANGDKKKVCELTTNDLLLVYDLYSGEYIQQYPLMIEKGNEVEECYRMTFDDGNYIDICGEYHNVFDPMLHQFTLYGENGIHELSDKTDYYVMSQDKNMKIVSIEKIHKHTTCYGIMTTGTMTAIANDVVIGFGTMGRIFDINKYNVMSEQRKTEINNAMTYEEFKKYVPNAKEELVLGYHLNYANLIHELYEKETIERNLKYAYKMLVERYEKYIEPKTSYIVRINNEEITSGKEFIVPEGIYYNPSDFKVYKTGDKINLYGNTNLIRKE